MARWGIRWGLLPPSPSLEAPAMTDPTSRPTSPDRTERLLGSLALALLLVVGVAIARGQSQWGAVPSPVWPHLLAAIVALALTPAILWGRRGTRLHRGLGWAWVSAMGLTAAASLGVKGLIPGHFSPIHLLSLYTLGMLPLVVVYARRGDHMRHRRAVRGLIIGALLIAGAFTLLPMRLLGHWLLD